ncbi:MAG: ABC transporter ATP-binding protein [Candidatus Eisenbacteria bacterium]
MNAAIEVTGLRRSFGDFIAVDGVTFSVGRGEIFGLLGANGAGKSTTIRMLTGLLAPSAGKAVVAGVDIGAEPGRVQEKIGYVPQRFSLYDELRVSENLEFMGGVYGLKGRRLRQRMGETEELLGLGPVRRRRTGPLAAGWKQRVSLAAALLHEPELLFLDEPTAGVDPAARRRLWGIVYDLAAAGTTVLVTTHYMDEAEYIHRILILHAGRVAAAGTPSELKESFRAATVGDAFLEVVRRGEEGR